MYRWCNILVLDLHSYMCHAWVIVGCFIRKTQNVFKHEICSNTKDFFLTLYGNLIKLFLSTQNVFKLTCLCYIKLLRIPLTCVQTPLRLKGNIGTRKPLYVKLDSWFYISWKSPFTWKLLQAVLYPLNHTNC